MKKSTTSIIVVSILIFFILLTFVFRSEIVDFINNLNEIKGTILSFGRLAGIAMVFMIAAQIILAPIPGAPFVSAAGFIFGFWEGTLYAILGTLIGGYIAFMIGKKYGRPFLIKVFNRDNFVKLEEYSNKKKLVFLFVVFLIPIAPADIIVFLAGASGLSLRSFLTVLFLGRLPSILVGVLIGAGFAHSNLTLVAFLIATISLISLVIYLYKGKINERLRKHTTS